MPEIREANYPVPRAMMNARRLWPWVPDIALMRNSGMTVSGWW
jgi:hypothetical protein